MCLILVVEPWPSVAFRLMLLPSSPAVCMADQNGGPRKTHEAGVHPLVVDLSLVELERAAMTVLTSHVKPTAPEK